MYSRSNRARACFSVPLFAKTSRAAVQPHVRQHILEADAASAALPRDHRLQQRLQLGRVPRHGSAAISASAGRDIVFGGTRIPAHTSRRK